MKQSFFQNIFFWEVFFLGSAVAKFVLMMNTRMVNRVDKTEKFDFGTKNREKKEEKKKIATSKFFWTVPEANKSPKGGTSSEVEG